VTGEVVHARGADQGERLSFGEITILVRIPAEATGGAFTFLEEMAPMADTPLHVHRHEDELFYVLEGEHVYRVGDDEYLVGPGGLVFAPRGLPHSQRRVVPGHGRQLVLTAPGRLGAVRHHVALSVRATQPRVA
jgi:mannose-6-phosphate isomerase-like protein (cupin superfamily)